MKTEMPRVRRGIAEIRSTGVFLSVVTPVYNEEKNLPLFFDRLTAVLRQLGRSYEIIAVNDGSTDASLRVLRELSVSYQHTRVIEFQTNFGQTAALSAGIEEAQGEIIISIDSDLENDPKDLPRLLAKLEEGYDVVSGWRKSRWQSAFFSRRLPSQIANWLISQMTGVYLHDYGCTLKAYRAEIVKGVRLYGEMHRFIPAYASWRGGRVTEISVNHEPRQHGKSNYGISRTLHVLLDLVVAVFMHRYMNRPIHFFGTWGFLSILAGVLIGFTIVCLRFFDIPPPVESLPILTALLVLVGAQLVLFGVMAEMLMRTYYESQNKRPYVIKH